MGCFLYVILAAMLNSSATNILKHPSTVLSVVLLLALGLRLININIQPLWGDEIFGLGVIKSFDSLSQLIQYLQLTEVYPPLYHVIYHYWTNWFGFAEHVVRIPTVIAGIAIVVITYYLSKSLFEKKEIAYLAAFFVAILPSQIYFSHIVRPYIFFTLVALLAVWFYWLRLSTQKKYFSPLFVLVNLIGFYLHYSYLFFFAPLYLFWLGEVLWSKRSNWQKEIWEWLLVGSSIFIGFYPWLSTFFYKIEIGRFALYDLERGGYLLERPLAFSSEVLNQLVWIIVEQKPHALEVVAIWIFKLTLLLSLIYSLVKTPEPLVVKLKQDGKALLMIFVIIVASFSLFIFSPYAYAYSPIYQQHILPVSVLLMILLAYFIFLFPLRLRWLVAGLFVVSLFNFIYITVQDESQWNPNYRLGELADFVNENASPNALVLTGYPILRTDLNYYLREDLDTISFYPTNYYGNDFMADRLRLGIFESEMHFRVGNPDKKEAFDKLERLTRDPSVNEIWLVHFYWPELAVEWFNKNGWRAKLQTKGKFRRLMPFDLYVKNNVQEQKN